MTLNVEATELSLEQLEEVIREVGSTDQAPFQHEMQVKTTLERTGVNDARISTAGKEKERFTFRLAVMGDG